LNAQQNLAQELTNIPQLQRRDDQPGARSEEILAPNATGNEPDSVQDDGSNGTPSGSPLSIAVNDTSAAGGSTGPGGSSAGDSLVGAGSGTSDLSESTDSNQGLGWSDPLPESPPNQAGDWFTDKLYEMAKDEINDHATEMLKEGISNSGEVGEIAVNLYDNATGAYNTVSSWKNAWTELNSSDTNTQIQGSVDATLNLNDEFNANPVSKAIVSTFTPVIGNVYKQGFNMLDTISSSDDPATAQAQFDDGMAAIQQAFVPAPLIKLQAIMNSQGFASFSSTVKKIWNWNPFVDTCTGFGC
jgi:hypothetical protein